MNKIEIEPAYSNALRIVHKRLENQPVDWAITGSLGFVLQGVKVQVNDIDLQTDEPGAYLIEKTLSAFSTKKVWLRTSEQLKSHYGALDIEGVQVEIMGALQQRNKNGEWDPPVDIREYRCWVAYNQMRLPVLSLAYEHQAYLRLGRIEKVRLLEKYLDSKA